MNKNDLFQVIANSSVYTDLSDIDQSSDKHAIRFTYEGYRFRLNIDLEMEENDGVFFLHAKDDRAMRLIKSFKR